MAPLSYLSVIIQHPSLSRPSSSQFGYLPLVGIAVVILLLIVNCGDGDAPVGPRRRDASYDSWSNPEDSDSVADVEIGHDMYTLPQLPMEPGRTSSPAPSIPPPSPTEPPPYSRQPPFPY